MFLALVEVDELCFEELVTVGLVAAAYVKMRFAVTGFATLTDGDANVVFAAVVTSSRTSGFCLCALTPDCGFAVFLANVGTTFLAGAA